MKGSHSHGILITLAIMWTACESVARRDLLRQQDAVTPLTGSEDFYVQVKRIIPKTYVDDDGKSGQLRDADYTGKIRFEDLENSTLPLDGRKPEEKEVKRDLADKSEICARIFNRFLFEINHECAANFEIEDETTRNELYRNNRNLYKDIYAEWPLVNNEWLNPYKRHVVAVGDEKFQEHVFRCVTRTNKSEEFSYAGYFVSPIYQLRTAENLFMDGRFLFSTNSDQNDELNVFAIAEESAVINRYVIEETHSAYYSEKRHRRKETGPESNVFCRLSVRDKIRLCTIALNAPHFPDNIRFLPNEASIEPDCKRRRVSARIWVEKQTWYSIVQPEPSYTTQEIELKYNEWMIGCRAVQILDKDEKSWSVYYISRGLEEYTAIIFKAHAEDTSIHSYSPFIGLSYVLMARGRGTIKPITYSSRKVKP